MTIYPGPEPHTRAQVISTQQSRQGESTGHVRYVLGASLILAVVAGIFLYLTFM